MWFDVQSALAEIEGPAPAAEAAPRVAHVARPPTPEPADCERRGEVVILAAIRAGNRRPIATATALGATATYQALDRMQAAGLVEVARDGTISAKEADNE